MSASYEQLKSEVEQLKAARDHGLEQIAKLKIEIDALYQFLHEAGLKAEKNER